MNFLSRCGSDGFDVAFTPLVLGMLLFILFKNRDAGYRMLLVTSVSVLINVILQHALVQESLLHQNHDLPSNYIQFVTVFYGAFFYEVVSRKRILLSCLFTSLPIGYVTFVTVRHGCYNWPDILMTIAISVLILCMFYRYAINIKISLRVRSFVLSALIALYVAIKAHSITYSGSGQKLMQADVFNIIAILFPSFLLVALCYVSEEKFNTLLLRAQISKRSGIILALVTTLTIFVVSHYYSLFDARHVHMMKCKESTSLIEALNTNCHNEWFILDIVEKIANNFWVLFTILWLNLVPLRILARYKKAAVQKK